MTNSFWHMTGADGEDKRADWTDRVKLEMVQCPKEQGHQRSGKRLTDLSVTVEGPDFEDIIWTWGGDCLIQDRVLRLLQESRFTGFDVKPVEVTIIKSHQAHLTLPPFWELVVVGWGGIAPPSTGIRLIKEYQCCGHKVYSTYREGIQLVDKGQWDGSDFFMVWPLPRFIFVSDRVAQFLSSRRIKGLQLIPSDQLKNPLKGLSEVLTPGRLAHWMPESRARPLGVPLGIY